ncbi:hypothetical protein HWV07_16640 [Natronomonas salina]|uniref:gas vesicle protein GvpH n=1 Tax=Natronomonas salina TaxID=1710540 RepID=UPI0015B4D211|nr:gas vesicle protein GvpH [Natronomonas salina]QLD90574.1 hypothetical protein HWV07_16640 [Natronomonas salina]
MSDERDGADDDDETERQGGLLGGIRSVLEALADAERDGKSRISRRRRSSKGRFSTESGFSVRVGRPSSGSDANSINDRSSASDQRDVDHHVDVRHDDDGRLVVVADLPNVDPDDLTVGLDEETNELVVGVEDRAVERLALPWPVDDVEGRFNHGVLELRITATEDAS